MTDQIIEEARDQAIKPESGGLVSGVRRGSGEGVNFREIRLRCSGMLPDRTYQAIYEAVRQSPRGSVVEVGTAHGAATICMAKALQAVERQDRVFTFERARGGSREKFGDVAANVHIISDNFAYFDVNGFIQLTVGDVDQTGRTVETGPVSVLLLDADGRIDRDFGLFYNKVVPGGVIMVDDCSDKPNIYIDAIDRLRIDLKDVLTFKLVSFYVNRGLMVETNRMGNFVFFEKTSEGDYIDFDSLDVLPVYRQLVFSEIRESLPGVAMTKFKETKAAERLKRLVRPLLRT
jgi:predicted O-methyltransferase YrrM